MAWKDLTGKQKALIVGAGGVVVFLSYKALHNGGQGVTTPPTSAAPDAGNTPVDSSGAVMSALSSQGAAQTQAIQQLAGGIQQSMQDQTNGILSALQQNQSALTQALTSQQQATTGAISGLISQMGQAQAQIPVNPPTTSPAIVPPPAHTERNYATITLPTGTSTTTAIQTAIANPGSPVKTQDNSTYAISKADANGNLHTATSYNSAVNDAGGQFINHKFFAGAYGTDGKFYTFNQTQQAQYNKLVPANK